MPALATARLVRNRSRSWRRSDNHAVSPAARLWSALWSAKLCALGRSVVGPCSGPQGAAGAYLEQDLPKVWEAADDVFEHTPTGCDPDGGCGAADPVVREGPKRCVSLSASERNFPSRG